MPSANDAANTTPMAVSSLIFSWRVSTPMPSALRIPATSPPQNRSSVRPFVRWYMKATPGRMAWASASPKNAMPRTTTYVPSTPLMIPTMIAASMLRASSG